MGPLTVDDEERMVCVTLRWRELDSKFQFRATFSSLTSLRDTESGQSSWVLSEFVSTHCTGANFGFDFRLTGFDAWLSTAICCL